MELIKLEDLSFKYPSTNKNALDNISLSINEGEFIVVCGESGCGKTTLLKMIKKQLVPFGEKSGQVLYNNVSIENLDEKTSACDIGFVLQNPEAQIVTDKVWHELAFGLENMGEEPSVIRRKVGEIASYFDISGWFRQDTHSLSGGQKQLLNLASIMVMQPKVLILDEPTSQLDPIASSEFIDTLKKLNKEFGLTIILVEHRLEEVLTLADKVLVLENGKNIVYDIPSKIPLKLSEINKKHKMLRALPSSVRIFGDDLKSNCPLTVKQGKAYLKENYKNDIKQLKIENKITDNQTCVEFKDVWFRYNKDDADVLKGLNLQINKGEIFSVVGSNGCGKTTALNILCCLIKPYRGKIKINGQKCVSRKEDKLYKQEIALLPQDPTTVFVRNTVKEDLKDVLLKQNIENSKIDEQIKEVARTLRIEDLLENHPFDLSGGEIQKCALAKLLLFKPKIILLDEPTKGYDAFSKEELQKLLLDLKRQGITIIVVTHDVEFAAEVSDRCGLMFDGEVVSVGNPQQFFSENYFYTTPASRISRGFYKNAVTCSQVAQLCKINGEIND